MKILITGAGGFIGSCICRTLVGRFPEAAIVGVTRTPSPSPEPFLQNYESVACDLLEDGFDKKLPAQANVVIHLAGDPRNPRNPDAFTSQVSANVMMTSRVADYAAKAKADFLIFASSAAIYSGNPRLPFVESEIEFPVDNLGATKLAAESLLKARSLAGQFKVLALRIFTAYGPGARPETFVSQAIAKLRSADPVANFGAAEAKRDFVYVDDVARSVVAGMALRKTNITYEALNIGTGQKTSIRKVVDLLANILGVTKQIEFDTRGGAKANSEHQADLTHTSSLLDWRPQVSLETGLRLTTDYITSSGKP
jgi:nucleoside-diphosphate-sugar epimerase